MYSKFNYKVTPVQICVPEYVPKKSSNDLVLALIFAFIIFSAAIFIASVEEAGLVVGIMAFIFITYILIVKADNDKKDTNELAIARSVKANSESQQLIANNEAEYYSQKLNSLLDKSHEIFYSILPNYESLAKKSIELAKIDFKENAFSPFWSNIENASSSLALFKEALAQLCLNSELYIKTLKYLNHNFPTQFPFSKNISISQTVEDYKTIIRKAHTHPTFSIIWEQRRNTKVLVGGFKTLEDAIFNMSNELHVVITDLITSITSNFDELKYLQSSQVRTLNECSATLNQTLNSMDTKLYYVQWNKKPLDKFEHR